MTDDGLFNLGWHHQHLAGFDLETTGIDVENDRIVTASLVDILPGPAPRLVETYEALANPGIEIPQQATAVHGVTTERARAEGYDPRIVIEAMVAGIVQAMSDGTPVIGMNISYDLTLLDRECRRHAISTIEDRLGRAMGPVVDVGVLDRKLSRRRGGRKLTDLCDFWKVSIGSAHNSSDDAIAACRVAFRICQEHPEIATTPLDKLHEQQVGWRAEQQRSLAAYFARTPGKEHLAQTVDECWPYRPFVGAPQ